MTGEPLTTMQPTPTPRWRSRLRAGLVVLLAALVLYLIAAFLILPYLWRTHEGRHPALTDAPTLTHTKSGIPGDPLNIGLLGTEERMHRAMLAAKWYPADSITMESALRIAADVVFKRPFDAAPVSPLYLWGRKQDLAYEQPVGDNPRHRHHVRFWRSKELDAQGRPLWLGAATLDVHVGFSHDTGQITHHISPDVDAERDKIIADLQKAGELASVDWIEHFQDVLSGKNGEGDPWRTDGRLEIGFIVPRAGGQASAQRP